MAGPTKVFGGQRYHLYTNFTGTGKNSGKRQAQLEAKRLRATGKWLARIVKSPWGGWDIYTKPKGR